MTATPTSAAPIPVLSTDALTHGTGSADLRQALGQTIPSFTAQQFGNDTANLTLSAALRGLSPTQRHVGLDQQPAPPLRLQPSSMSMAAISPAAVRRPDHLADPEAAIDHVEECCWTGHDHQYRNRCHCRRGEHHPQEQILVAAHFSSHDEVIMRPRWHFPTDNGPGGRRHQAAWTCRSYNMGLPLFDARLRQRHDRKAVLATSTQNGGSRLSRGRRHGNGHGLALATGPE